MDIREMEQRTGLNRANIRFYEKEGLLAPTRRENGYRDYSSEDEKTLMRIKLLRRLKVTIEEIRLLQNSDEELSTTLDRRLREIMEQKRELAAAQKVCERMREDGVCYGSLNAVWYLNMLDAEEKRALPSADIQPESYVLVRDVERQEPHPVRRLLARYLDLRLYHLIWVFLLNGMLCVSPTNDWISILGNILALVTMYVLEPLLISRFAATPGKWLMGIRIRDVSGEKLCYADARTRTGEVMWYGMGLEIPIYSWVRLWKSYKEYAAEGEESSWNRGVEYEFLEWKRWNGFAWAGAEAAVFVLMILSMLAVGTRPVHRGELTVDQFVENYKHYNRYFYSGEAQYMNSEGKVVNEAGVVVVYVGSEEPEWSFREENGVLVEISCKQEVWGNRAITQILTAAAFAGAQPEVSFWNHGGVLGIIDMMEKETAQYYTKQYGDVIMEVSGDTVTLRKE